MYKRKILSIIGSCLNIQKDKGKYKQLCLSSQFGGIRTITIHSYCTQLNFHLSSFWKKEVKRGGVQVLRIHSLLRRNSLIENFNQDQKIHLESFIKISKDLKLYGKKSKISIYILELFVLSIFISSAVFASDVPFEVFKTYVTVEASDTSFSGTEAVAIDGVLYDSNAEGKKFGYPPPKGEFDKRVKIPVEAVHYKLEFWNVGKMGGEKGFIFKSDYGKAKLTRTYELGQAYRMVENGKTFMGLKGVEKRKARTPNVKTTFVDELTFFGGPYGKFYYTAKDGLMYQIAHISEGRYIIFDNVPENTNPKKPRYLMTLGYAMDVQPEIINSPAFEKWMEILSQNNQEGCSEAGSSRKDSGIRFSDYNGEVMVRPCDDEDAWYNAELDMVLHVDDHVKTGDDSSCVLSFPDMTTFIMKPESEVILSSPPEKEDKIKLIWGKIKTNFKQMMKDGTMDVEMSQGVLGIKGTIFIAEETGTESTLKVIEGHVEFTSKATGKSEMIGSGEMITATEKGLEKKKKFDIAKENATWKSNEAMTKGVFKQKGKNQKKAKELLQEARKLWKEGKLQQAISKASQAQKLSGKDKEIAKTLKAMQRQKKDLDAKLDEAVNLIKKGDLKETEKILSSAARINEQYKRYKEVLKQLADAKKKVEEKKKQINHLLADTLKLYEGRYFDIKYPADFTAYPPNRKGNMSDEATFVSPDGDVEFYIYSPQWSGKPSYLNKRENEIIESDSNKRVHNRKKLEYTYIHWRTYKDKHGKYERAYMHKRVCPSPDQESGCTTLVFGIKFKNKTSYDRYKKEYIRFKKSLEQYAD